MSSSDVPSPRGVHIHSSGSLFLSSSFHLLEVCYWCSHIGPSTPLVHCFVIKHTLCWLIFGNQLEGVARFPFVFSTTNIDHYSPLIFFHAIVLTISSCMLNIAAVLAGSVLHFSHPQLSFVWFLGISLCIFIFHFILLQPLLQFHSKTVLCSFPVIYRFISNRYITHFKLNIYLNLHYTFFSNIFC